MTILITKGSHKQTEKRGSLIRPDPMTWPLGPYPINRDVALIGACLAF